MGQPKRVVAPRDSQRYRELASKLRGIARQSRIPGTRQKILDLALRFETEAQRRISLETQLPPRPFDDLS